MMLFNYYTREIVDYPVNIDTRQLEYQIKHETPFSDRFSEWSVSVLDNGDELYIPSGNNRCTDVYVVTELFLKHIISPPHGVYTMSLMQFVQYYQ